MSAKHALLGLLLDRPAYPYQLADRLQQRLGPAWKVHSGQLYQLVKGLEDDGLIEREGNASGEAERHVYSITERGVSEFERWFEQNGTGVRLCRRPLLMKITFAGPQRLDDTLDKVDAYEADCARQLKEIAAMRETLPQDGPLVRAEQLLLRLNLSADIFQLEGELRWARHAREMLSWLSSREAVWPSGEGPSAPQADREHGSNRSAVFRRMAGQDEDRGPRPSGGAEED